MYIQEELRGYNKQTVEINLNEYQHAKRLRHRKCNGGI